MSERIDSRTDTAPERLNTNEARQAVAPRRLRYMLAFGLLGVVVAFAIIYTAFVGW